MESCLIHSVCYW